MTKKAILIARYAMFCLSFFLLFAACNKASVEPPATTPPGVTPPVVKKWIVSTVAGFADGDTTQVKFNNPQGIVADNNGNLFVGDLANASIRQITYAGHVTTYMSNNVGSPNPAFGNIYGMVRDSKGSLFTIEYSLIRKIISPTNSAVFAGSLAVDYKDGNGPNAVFNIIGNMTIDKQDNIYVPDYDMNNIFHLRKVTPGGEVSTVALTDNTGFSADGLPNYHYLYAIAVDATGNIYITANGNCMIKKIDPAGKVTIFAGRGDIGFVDGKGRDAVFFDIDGMTCDASGNLWVCDASNHAIRKVTPDGTVTTIAGTGTMGYADGEGSKALFKYPVGITVDNNGVVFVTDNGNNRIRKLEYK